MTETLRQEAYAQLVQSRLSADMRTCGQTIDVVVEDGDIFLVGTCDTSEQRTVAQMIAAGTCGVGRVIVNIHVRKLAQAI